MTIVPDSDYFSHSARSAGTELWDGNLLVRPRETPRHELCLSALAGALRIGLTGLHVLTGVAVRLGPGRVALPDLVITSAIDLDEPVVTADAVRLICEVVSPASAVMDRVLKMHGYAAAGIPCYLVAEPEEGALHSNELSGDRYLPGPMMQLVQVTGVDFTAT
jgi:Uma2 family endonuclease